MADFAYTLLRAPSSSSEAPPSGALDAAAQPLLRRILAGDYTGDEMVGASVLPAVLTAAQRAAHTQAVLGKVRGEAAFSSAHESRALACMLCMACGDALGHTLEFFPVRYGVAPFHSSLAASSSSSSSSESSSSNSSSSSSSSSSSNSSSSSAAASASSTFAASSDPIVIDKMLGGGRFMLRPGQWTDDTSMGLCLADSLLLSSVNTATGAAVFDPLDVMLRFEAWWHFGYNNAFANDAARQNKHSVGLGGNISHALRRFLTEGEPQTRAGNRQTSGNGGIMRLAPVPVTFFRTPALAMRVARASSLVTHQGEEAAECARLLALICSEAIRRSSGDAAVDPRQLLDSLADLFTSSEPSVEYLARGQQEPGGGPDRNWEWRRQDYKYAPTRAASCEVPPNNAAAAAAQPQGPPPRRTRQGDNAA